MGIGSCRKMEEFDDTLETLGDIPEVGEKPTRLWKTNDAKAQKEGPRRTIYSSVKEVGRAKETFTGQWHDNQKDGMGTQVYKNEDRYVGTWQNNKRHGQGEYYKMVKGQLIKRYAGEWKNGLRDGLGMLFGDDGELYDGEWSCGKRHGHGKQVYANGDVYEGRWGDHRRHGFGKLTTAAGDVFEGHYLDDKKEGSGTFYYIARKKRLDGEWVEDTCKCGVMSDLDLQGEQDSLPPKWGDKPTKKLPQIGLKDARNVLDSCLGRVRSERGAVRLQKTPVEEIFDPDDLEQLLNCFNAIDCDNYGSISLESVQSAFYDLGLPEISSERLQELIQSLEVNDSDEGVNIETFCRIVALSV